MVMKKCRICGEEKPLSQFNKNRKSLDGRCRSCKSSAERRRLTDPEKRERQLEAGRRWYANHRETGVAATRRWQLSNPDKKSANNRNRRARERNADGKITSQEWQAICKKYGNKCLRCGRNDVPLTMDHIVPLAKGGTHTADNVQPLCHSCNASKRHLHSTDYRTFIHKMAAA